LSWVLDPGSVAEPGISLVDVASKPTAPAGNFFVMLDYCGEIIIGIPFSNFAGSGIHVAAAAAVGCFPLLAVLVLVGDEDPARVAGARALVLGLGNFGERTPYNIGVHR
jgi:hypothetical protein